MIDWDQFKYVINPEGHRAVATVTDLGEDDYDHFYTLILKFDSPQLNFDDDGWNQEGGWHFRASQEEAFRNAERDAHELYDRVMNLSTALQAEDVIAEYAVLRSAEEANRARIKELEMELARRDFRIRELETEYVQRLENRLKSNRITRQLASDRIMAALAVLEEDK